MKLSLAVQSQLGKHIETLFQVFSHITLCTKDRTLSYRIDNTEYKWESQTNHITQGSCTCSIQASILLEDIEPPLEITCLIPELRQILGLDVLHITSQGHWYAGTKQGMLQTHVRVPVRPVPPLITRFTLPLNLWRHIIVRQLACSELITMEVKSNGQLRLDGSTEACCMAWKSRPTLAKGQPCQYHYVSKLLKLTAQLCETPQCYMGISTQGLLCIQSQTLTLQFWPWQGPKQSMDSIC